MFRYYAGTSITSTSHLFLLFHSHDHVLPLTLVLDASVRNFKKGVFREHENGFRLAMN